MSDLDYGRLREIAEAAPSESEWVAEPIGAPDEGPTNHLIYEKRAPAGERVQYLVAWTDYDEAGWRFSEYIAAFDPPTALALLDRIEQQDAELAEYREREAGQVYEYGVRYGDYPRVQGFSSREEAEFHLVPTFGDQLIRRVAARSVPAGEWMEVTDDD